MGRNSDLRIDKVGDLQRRITLYGENLKVAGHNALTYTGNLARMELARVVKTAPNKTKGPGRIRDQHLLNYAKSGAAARVFTTRSGAMAMQFGYGPDAPFYAKYQELGTVHRKRLQRGILPMHSVMQAWVKSHREFYTLLAKQLYQAGETARAGKLMKRANNLGDGAAMARAAQKDMARQHAQAMRATRTRIRQASKKGKRR